MTVVPVQKIQLIGLCQIDEAHGANQDLKPFGVFSGISDGLFSLLGT